MSITTINYKSGRELKIIDNEYVIGAGGSCNNEIKYPKKVLNGGYVIDNKTDEFLGCNAEFSGDNKIEYLKKKYLMLYESFTFAIAVKYKYIELDDFVENYTEKYPVNVDKYISNSQDEYIFLEGNKNIYKVKNNLGKIEDDENEKELIISYYISFDGKLFNIIKDNLPSQDLRYLYYDYDEIKENNGYMFIIKDKKNNKFYNVYYEKDEEFSAVEIIKKRKCFNLTTDKYISNFACDYLRALYFDGNTVIWGDKEEKLTYGNEYYYLEVDDFIDKFWKSNINDNEYFYYYIDCVYVFLEGGKYIYTPKNNLGLSDDNDAFITYEFNNNLNNFLLSYIKSNIRWVYYYIDKKEFWKWSEYENYIFIIKDKKNNKFYYVEYRMEDYDNKPYNKFIGIELIKYGVLNDS